MTRFDDLQKAPKVYVQQEPTTLSYPMGARTEYPDPVIDSQKCMIPMSPLNIDNDNAKNNKAKYIPREAHTLPHPKMTIY